MCGRWVAGFERMVENISEVDVFGISERGKSSNGEAGGRESGCGES